MIVSTKVKINEQQIKSRIQAACKSAQPVLDSAVLTDSNYFVPVKTGALQKSGILKTRLGSGEIIWSTPYARRLYYTYEKPAGQINPNACARWFEAAKARWLKKWVRLVNEHIKRR